MKLETAAPVRTLPPPIQALNRVWAVGQLLDVTVIGTPTPNSMTLRIGRLTVEATGVPPLPVGTRFAARVSEMLPQPVLTPVPEMPTTQSPRAAEDALRALLPRQIDAAPAWRDVSALTARLETMESARAAPALTQAARAVLAQIPDITSLDSAEKVRQAVARSGSGLEATLAAQVLAGDSKAPGADRKWQLLELLQQLQAVKPTDAFPARGIPSPQGLAAGVTGTSTDLVPGAAIAGTSPAATDLELSSIAVELRDRTEGLLATLTTRQLQTVAAAEQGQVFGLIELPVRLPQGTDVVELEYSCEGAESATPTTASHSLLVIVPIEGHELRVRLNLAGEHLSVVAWADDPGLREALESRQDALASRLTNCGFEIGHFVVAPVAGSVKAAHLPNSLIDTRI